MRYALENPALFRLMFGPKRPGAHPDLAAAGEAAYAVLTARVATTAAGADPEARVLGCWSLVHGLASLLLDGRISDKAEPDDALTRRVAEAMLNAA